MRYSAGECVADYGFNFFEKIHEPILLVSKLGRIIKMNEAGRKLARVAHLNISQMENLISAHILGRFKNRRTERIRMNTRKLGFQIVATIFKDSDYFLIEVKR